MEADAAMTQAAAQALREGNVGGAMDAAEPLMEKLLSGFALVIDMTDRMKQQGKVDIQQLELPSEYSPAETALKQYSALGQVHVIAYNLYFLTHSYLHGRMFRSMHDVICRALQIFT